MSKEVQKTPRKNDLNLIILELLKRGYRPSRLKVIDGKKVEKGSICAILQMKKNTLQYRLNLLKKAGYVQKLGYGVWQVSGKEYTQNAIREVQRASQVTADDMGKNLNFLNPDDSRGHGFMFHVKVPARVRNWERRAEILKKKGIQFEPLKNLGGGQKLIFKGRKVHLKNSSIIIYETKSFVAELASGAKKLAIYELLKMVKSLEKHIGADFSIKGEYQFKVCRSHYALVKNSLAKQYDKAGRKLQVYNSRGLWMVIDNSFNLHELETLQNKDGEKRVVEQNEGMSKFMNEMNETNFQVTPNYIKSNFEEAEGMLKKVSQMNIQFSQVMEQISKNVVRLGGEVAAIKLKLDD